MQETKINVTDTITNLLLGTNRDGMLAMVDYLVKGGFFEAPASTRFHGSHAGGLAEHSLDVYTTLAEFAVRFDLDGDTSAGKKPLALGKDTLIVAGLLHDICKIGAYIPTGDEEKPYKWNKQQPEGHATLSIERAKNLIELAPIEELMIRYHMGIYGMYEYYDPHSWEYKTQPEYHIRSKAKKPKNPTPEEKKADQEARYGKSWRNAVYHNPIVKLMYFCDELATMDEKERSRVENERPL